jgi:hypothetical protein
MTFDNRPSAPAHSFHEPAKVAFAAALRAGVDAYDRKTALARFPRLSRAVIDSGEPGAAREVLREIETALRKERRRAGHWTYDLNRHIGLLTAFRAEQERLCALESATHDARPR